MVGMWFGIIGIVLGTGGIILACWQRVDRKYAEFELAEALEDIKRKDKRIKELENRGKLYPDWKAVRRAIQGQESEIDYTVKVFDDPPEPGA